MIRIEHEHYFAMPVEAGFAFITDMANWPRYWPGFVRIESGSRWSAPGDEACIVVRLLGGKLGPRRYVEDHGVVLRPVTRADVADRHLCPQHALLGQGVDLDVGEPKQVAASPRPPTRTPRASHMAPSARIPEFGPRPSRDWRRGARARSWLEVLDEHIGGLHELEQELLYLVRCRGRG